MAGHVVASLAIVIGLLGGCGSAPSPTQEEAKPIAVPAPTAEASSAAQAPARDVRCSSLDAKCSFDEMNGAFVAMHGVVASPDEVRTISYWLEAGGGYGGLYEAKCQLMAGCGKLCRAELMNIDARDLAKVVATKPTFAVSSAQLAAWAQPESLEPRDAPSGADPALTLRAGPIADRAKQATIFLELEHPCAGGATAGGVAAGAPPASPPQANITPPRLKVQPQCTFPKEATADQGVVVVDVFVDATGAVTSTTIALDPGSFFGRAAKSCMEKAAFEPGRDAQGQPVAAKVSIKVRFERP